MWGKGVEEEEKAKSDAMSDTEKKGRLKANLALAAVRGCEHTSHRCICMTYWSEIKRRLIVGSY